MRIKELKRRIKNLKDSDDFVTEQGEPFNWLIVRGNHKVIRCWTTKQANHPKLYAPHTK